MWTPTTRQHHSWDHLRYGSDLTDSEWGDDRPTHAATGQDRAAESVVDARSLCGAGFSLALRALQPKESRPGRQHAAERGKPERARIGGEKGGFQRGPCRVGGAGKVAETRRGRGALPAEYQ